MRPLAAGAALVLGVSLSACSSGGHPRPLVPITHPAAGYGAPGAAVTGFFTQYAAGKNTACAYVQSSDFLSCDEAITENGVKATISGFGIGQTTIQGNSALVTVIGKLCVTQGHTTTCRQNSDPSVGQPRSGDQKQFNSLYAKAGVGRPINTSALPCQKISGKWYISLEGNETG